MKRGLCCLGFSLEPSSRAVTRKGLQKPQMLLRIRGFWYKWNPWRRKGSWAHLFHWFFLKGWGDGGTSNSGRAEFSAQHLVSLSAAVQ